MVAYAAAILIIVGIYALLTQSLNLQYGFTGLVNFGHVGFFAIGAYASALITLSGLPFVAGFAAAAVLPALAAYPLGVLALRLRDDYLAIVALGFAEVVRIVIVSEDWLTSGVQGISGIPRPFQELGTGPAELVFLGLVVGLNLVVAFAIWRLAHSAFGRLIQAIRDDEMATIVLGKNPPRAKMQVFMLGAGIAGFAGALYAHYITYLVPDQFMAIVTFQVWAAMILGGVGSLSGSILGAFILVGLLEGSRFIRDLAPGVMEVEMASVRLAIVGIGLILFVLFRPQGIVGRMEA